MSNFPMYEDHQLVGQTLRKARQDHMKMIERMDYSEEGRLRRNMAFIVVNAVHDRWQFLYDRWYRDFLKRQ